MDPDANLKEQRELCHSLLDDPRNRKLADIADDAARLAELCEALDGWIADGGFLPAAWVRK